MMLMENAGCGEEEICGNEKLFPFEEGEIRKH
jgi:hypothetical protein